MPRNTAPASPYTRMTLACPALQVDRGIQPRLALNQAVVEEYATLYQEAEEAQEPLPPLDVFQVAEIYYVADGFHRLAAARQVSRETVPCHVYVGTHRDAMVHAALANIRRGLAYTPSDKQQVLERLLADPEIAQRGDRPLARDLGMSHMTVWRARKRQEEEGRLRAAIAALPATATAPQAREQEQLAAYLAVPVQALKDLAAQSSGGYSGLRGVTTPALIKDLAHDAAWSDFSPQRVAKTMAERIERLTRDEAAPRAPRQRPSMSKAAIAARKEKARREELDSWLWHALEGLIELYPFTAEEVGFEPDDPNYELPPTAEELVAAVLPKEVETVGERLTFARTVLEDLWRAWEARMQEMAASA